MKLYTLDNQFIEEVKYIPNNFTGIALYRDETKVWLLNAKPHNLDGPAVLWGGYDEEYWVYGKNCTEQQHKLLYSLLKLKGIQ